MFAKRTPKVSRLMEYKTMVLPALALALMSQETPTKDYVNTNVDLKMRYPADWELKREKLSDQLRFKVDGKQVYVDLMGIEMNFPASHWQEVTREINTNNDRAVLRQWEEEFLGVPLLLTKVRDISKADSEITITGLLMSNRPQRFLFRLFAPDSVSVQAEEIWNRVLLSADTVSGKLPSEALTTGQQGGGTTPPPTSDNGKTHVLRPRDLAPKNPVLGSQRTVLEESRGTFLYLPEGWTRENDLISLGATRVVFGHGIGDERVARRDWLQACGRALDRITRVESRVEPEMGYLDTGCKGTHLLRRGQKDGQTEVQWVAYGWKGGYFYHLSWFGTELEFKTAESQLATLHNRLAISSE